METNMPSVDEPVVCQNKIIFQNQRDSALIITNMGTKPKVSGYKCPWQNGVAERYVLSVRGDVLNRMVIFNEKQLHDLMKQYVEYYNNDRCHLSVYRDSPNGREIQNKPFGSARVISSAGIGGLHHISKICFDSANKN